MFLSQMVDLSYSYQLKAECEQTWRNTIFQTQIYHVYAHKKFL